MPLPAYAAVFRGRKMFLLLLLGFSSGLPLALTAGTLQAWLAAERVDIVAIGWFALVGQPYTYKFLWAPLMDRYAPPFLGRRRGWLLVTQALLAIAVLWMAVPPIWTLRGEPPFRISGATWNGMRRPMGHRAWHAGRSSRHCLPEDGWQSRGPEGASRAGR